MERRSAYAANKTWDVSVPADNKRKQPQSQCCQGVTICSLLGNKRGSSQRSSRAESERDFMSFTKSYFLQLTWHGLFKVKRHDGSYLIHRSKKTGKHEARTSPQASFLLELLFLCFLSSPHFCVFWWLFYGFGFDLGIDLLGGGEEKIRARTQRASPLSATQQRHFGYLLHANVFQSFGIEIFSVIDLL